MAAHRFCFRLALLFPIYGFVLTTPLDCPLPLAEVNDLSFEDFSVPRVPEEPSLAEAVASLM